MRVGLDCGIEMRIWGMRMGEWKKKERDIHEDGNKNCVWMEWIGIENIKIRNKCNKIMFMPFCVNRMILYKIKDYAYNKYLKLLIIKYFKYLEYN